MLTKHNVSGQKYPRQNNGFLQGFKVKRYLTEIFLKQSSMCSRCLSLSREITFTAAIKHDVFKDMRASQKINGIRM